MQDEKSKIGYVRLWQFNEQSDAQMEDALTKLENKQMKGMVLDLRGNPGGLLQVAVDIGSRFIASGPVVIIQERGGQKSYLNVEESQHRHKRVPLVVLVDGRSASASEIVAGAIKDDSIGTLVGTTTYGKGRVQTIMPLADGSAVAITTAKYLTPKGTDINKVGIKPDVVVDIPEEGFDPTEPAKDPQLKKAVEVLKQKMGLPPTPTEVTAKSAAGKTR
jgi:carboxyl-terminal processing protease